MNRSVLTVLVLAAGSVAFAAQDHQKSPPKADDASKVLIQTPDKIEWTAGPASFRKGAQMAMLDGDPAKEGPFVFRLKLPDGFRIAPHTHPGIERITVIQGTLNLGTGTTFDEKSTHPLPAGSFCRLPAGISHFGLAKGETVIQLNGVGPWGIAYLNSADDPRTAPEKGK